MDKQLKRDIRCAVCNTLFGIEHGDGQFLAMKSRDIYRLFRGGVVEGPCRRCGATVRWEAKAR